MRKLLSRIYYELRKEEICKASTRFKRIKIDTILQSLTKLCWKYNIQYEIIIKTSDVLIMKLIGVQETVVFKYHKTNMVVKEDIEFFMNELDEKKAQRGVYISTGEFQKVEGSILKSLFLKKDCMLEDSTAFIKRHLGMRGTAAKNFKTDRLNFFKYLPQ